MKSKTLSLLGLAFLLSLGVGLFTGCQSDINGQTLPSSEYPLDDVQYFPPGLEHRAPREAAALSEASAEMKQRQREMLP